MLTDRTLMRQSRKGSGIRGQGSAPIRFHLRWSLIREIGLLAIALAILLVVGCNSDSEKTTKQYETRSADVPISRLSENVGQRRHVLLLTVDTLRPDYLSSCGYDQPTSPFVDSLMSEGTRFSHALTPIPRTTQALANLLSGCYPHTTRVRTLFDSLTPEVVSIAQLAKNKGFATIAVVSNHILLPARKLDRGFDIYDFADDTRDASQTTRAAIRHLGSRKSEDPIFLWVHYIDPHVPYYPPRELARQFDPDYNGRYREHFGAVRGGIGDSAYPADLGKVRSVFRNNLPDELNTHIRKLYAADVRFTDDAIATLVKWIWRELGDDWLIVFTADHGESLGEHDFFYDHGDYVYNASLRVPLAFTFSRSDPLHSARTIRDWVSLVDVMPTLLELLDLELPVDLPYTVDGRSLVPYFRGDTLPPRACFAECGRSYFPKMVRRRVTFDLQGRFRAAVFGDWKLIWTPGQRPEMEYELYNVTEDPHETRNLYSSKHPEAERLRVLLKGWAKTSGPEAGAPASEDVESLRSLGYIE